MPKMSSYFVGDTVVRMINDQPSASQVHPVGIRTLDSGLKPEYKTHMTDVVQPRMVTA